MRPEDTGQDRGGSVHHRGLASAPDVPRTVAAAGPAGTRKFSATVRVDTPGEADYYRHGDILPYVLRSLAAQ
ncbi:MAG TPA: hypothetical protein VFQ68_16790 [Streptosporangiaceae bacterium]|nr:hypothetical protein [Streptosporangiaceae bacterium]